MGPLEARLEEKRRARIKRKNKFGVPSDHNHIDIEGEKRNGPKYQPKKKHWRNHAGTYRDQEQRKGPKWWNRPKPVRVYSTFKDYLGLIQALKDILAGRKNQDQYRGIRGLNRARLRTMQSLRDRRLHADLAYIARAGYPELKKL